MTANGLRSTINDCAYAERRPGRAYSWHHTYRWRGGGALSTYCRVHHRADTVMEVSSRITRRLRDTPRLWRVVVKRQEVPGAQDYSTALGKPSVGY